MKLGKYSFGMGDRFAQQGEAQLKAVQKAKELGIDIVPVWNKSNREHKTVNSSPSDTRAEADNAVKALKWSGSYYVDADHINLTNVDGFLEHSDFFTIDVADYIGKPAQPAAIDKFLQEAKPYIGKLSIPGIAQPFEVTEELIRSIADKFLFAAEEAGRIFRHIASKKGADGFIAEVSMDEVDEPQTPVQLFFILKALADNNVTIQTIAPKFTGRFNKGVDYVGNIAQFAKEFEEDILVIAHAVKKFNLPENLKLSVHSGSDKFSIYTPIKTLIRKHNAGLHVKTAGTTWLEELIGLAMADGEALELAKSIYKKSLSKYDELTAPYATVLDIDKSKLPTPEEVQAWPSKKFVDSLRHDSSNVDYNPNFRQLLHCAYKVAAEYGKDYINALKNNQKIVAQCVYENLYNKHIAQIFI